VVNHSKFMPRKIESFLHAKVGNPRELVHHLLQGNPRESVMVCCAMIDVTLADLIATGLRDDEKVLEDFLGTDADGRAPLGSFGARIQAAYLLELIDRLHFNVLSCLKRIRNLFAHRAIMSFKDERIVNEVKEIVRLAGSLGWRQRRNRTYTPPELFKRIVQDTGFGHDACWAYFVTAATMEFKDLHESSRRRRAARNRKKG
jgi:hypothetical protein